MTKYVAQPCPCGDEACTAWHVSPGASTIGVRFSEGQARAVAAVLNAVESGESVWDSGPIFPITPAEADVLHRLGWESGMGWDIEWDWWPAGEPDTRAEDADIRLRLVEHLTIIRTHAARAHESARIAIKVEGVD